MPKKWNTEKRYETGSDWVRASLKHAGIATKGDEMTRSCDLVGSTCKRRQGVWTRLKRPPRDDRGLIWYAFKIAMHYARWGDYGPWSEALTFQLMDASDKARDDFEFVLDQSISIAKKRKGAKENA